MNNVWNKSIGTSYTCIAWEITLHDRGGFFSSPNSSKIFFSTTSGNCFFQAGMERICYMFYEVFSNCVIFDFHAVEPNYLAISGTQKRMIHVRWCASSTAASEEANWLGFNMFTSFLFHSLDSDHLFFKSCSRKAYYHKHPDSSSSLKYKGGKSEEITFLILWYLNTWRKLGVLVCIKLY